MEGENKGRSSGNKREIDGALSEPKKKRGARGPETSSPLYFTHP